MKIILCNSQLQFEHYCIENDIPKNNREVVAFYNAKDLSKLMGLDPKSSELILYVDYVRSASMPELYQYIKHWEHRGGKVTIYDSTADMLEAIRLVYDEKSKVEHLRRSIRKYLDGEIDKNTLRAIYEAK